MHRSTIANTGVEVYIKTTNPLCECSGHDIDINRGHEFDSADNGPTTIKTNDTADGGSVITSKIRTN